MKKPRFTEQQIAQALRQAEQGTTAAEVCRKLAVSEATFYAGKKRYAGMGVAELRRVRQLEDEKSPAQTGRCRSDPRQADAPGGAAKKGVRPGRRRAIAHELIGAYRVSARRACGVVGCHRATFYYRARRRDVTPLRMRLRELAAARPRFGYRRLQLSCSQARVEILEIAEARTTFLLASILTKPAAIGMSDARNRGAGRQLLPFRGRSPTRRRARLS